MKTMVICSGGLDSVTLAYKVKAEHTLHSLLSFDYGQRHKKELLSAKQAAEDLQVPHHVIDISAIGTFLSGSALTDDIDVPEGHYAEDTMKATIVPNRNAIMLTIAYGVGAAQQVDAIAAAFHGGDHFIYPDCRPDFADSFNTMQKHALDGYADIQLLTPFIHQSKTDIAAEAGRLGVPVETTWSCYKGGNIHCGRCGTCVERREAMEDAGLHDPTQYEDRDYWQNAVKEAKQCTA